MKLPGSMRKSSEQIILNYSRAPPESRRQDSSKGGRFVVPAFYKNKISQKRRAYRLHIKFAVHIKLLLKIILHRMHCMAWHIIFF
jgi:hypothetical protein